VREAPSPHQKVFTLLVELRCNSYCVFCGQREIDEALIAARRRLALSVPAMPHGAQRERFTLESATGALERARAAGYTELSLQGGEPTIWRELPALVARARELGFGFIGVVTNGRKLRDAAFAHELIRAGLDGITISILGADARTHDALSAAEGSFDAMMEGLGHAVAAAASMERKVVVNANVIVSAKSVDHLDEIIALLADHGVTAATLRMVRFDGLASDPKVVGDLRFDGARLRRAVAAAEAACQRLGVSLNAHDIPVCLQPSVSAPQLRRVAAMAQVSDHRFEAPAYAYELTTTPRHEPACAGCLVERACPKLPLEYIEGAAPSLFRPVTSASLRESIVDGLGALDPAAAGAADRVAELLDAVDEMASLVGGEGSLAPTRALLLEATDDLMRLAARRRDGVEMLHAFHLLAGLLRPRHVVFDDSLWPVLARPLSQLAAAAGAISSRAAASWRRLHIGEVQIALELTEVDANRFRIARAAPVLPPDDAKQSRLSRALVLLTIAPAFSAGRVIRVAGDRVVVEADHRPEVVYVALRRDGIALSPAPATSDDRTSATS
jgi:MoaA/NifB/PqqE/SkfB family radical SAM enzyme